MDPREIREQAIRDAKCNLILDAAREIFTQQGFHESRLEDIALSAGFSKASLYNYYPDKEAIFLSLAIREYDRVILAIKTAVRTEAPFLENFQAILTTVFTHFGEHLGFLLTTSNFQKRAHLQAEMCKHEELMERMHSGVVDVLNTLEAVVRTARERNEMNSPISDAHIARLIGSLIRGAMLDWKMAGKIGDMESTIADMVEFVRNGIGLRNQNTTA